MQELEQQKILMQQVFLSIIHIQILHYTNPKTQKHKRLSLNNK